MIKNSRLVSKNDSNYLTMKGCRFALWFVLSVVMMMSKQHCFFMCLLTPKLGSLVLILVFRTCSSNACNICQVVLVDVIFGICSTCLFSGNLFGGKFWESLLSADDSSCSGLCFVKQFDIVSCTSFCVVDTLLPESYRSNSSVAFFGYDFFF